MGHTAEILTLDHPETSMDDFSIPVHVCGRSIHSYGISRAARFWLRSNADRFDGIVVHGLWQYQGLLALQELAGRYPYVLFTHGMLDPWFNREYPLKYMKKLPYWLAVERRILRGAHRVLFTSTVEADLACRSFPYSHWTPAIVPYGTAGPPSLPGEVEEQIKAFYDLVGLNRGEPYLLFAGRIHPKKGCDLLLQAYGTVAQETALPRLVMAGPDQVGLRAKLQQTAEGAGIGERVLWPGMVSGPAKWGAFRQADAFLLPSHQENFGIAVAEALSCGTPALISDQVNIHADVSRSGAGYVEPDTLEGTVALLRRWAATDADTRSRMREQSVRCWRDYFDSAGTSRAIADIFACLPNHRRAAPTTGREVSLSRDVSERASGPVS